MALYDTFQISDFIGLTFELVEGEVGGDSVLFKDTNGETYTMYHDQDCCEYVRIVDIIGDLNDLIGSPITMAKEATNSDDTYGRSDLDDSHTWTFYKLATVKGYVTIRWLGTSNGYYSESVSIKHNEKAQP